MKTIEMLSHMISDELDGAEEYITEAMQLKNGNQHLADTLYDISTQEMNHVNLLHEEVTRIIEEYKQKSGESKEGMMMLYNYLHKQHMNRAVKIKTMQSMYR